MKKQKAYKSAAEAIASMAYAKTKKPKKKKSKSVSGPAQDPAIGSGNAGAIG